MTRPKVYLAGPVSNVGDSGQKWRRAVRQSHWDSYEWVDPVAVLDYDPEEHTPEYVVDHDKGLIDECDAVLVGLTAVASVGTWREVEYAVETRDIPVSIWVEPSGSDLDDIEDRDWSPWMLEAGYVGPSFKNAMDHIDEVVDDE